MPTFTREAIKRTFVELLEERPISKITVKDVVDRCGINRNTFYYHFSDLPALAETIVTEDAQRILDSAQDLHSVEECLDTAIGFVMQNRRAVLNLYRAGNRDLFEGCQWRICRHVVERYIDTLSVGRPLAEEERTLAVDYLKWLLFGFVIDALNSGLDPEVIERFHRLCVLMHEEIERMVTGDPPA